MVWIGKTFVWKEDEIEFLKENYGRKSNKEIAKRLKNSPSIVSSKASSLGLEKDNPVTRYLNYKAISKHLEHADEMEDEVITLRKTIESINIQKERFIEKYLMVVWGGIIGGSVVSIISLNNIQLIFRFGLILTIIFLGLFVVFVYEMLKRKRNQKQ